MGIQLLVLFQVIDDFVNSVAGTNITILSQEIFENDPRTRVENLKVNCLLKRVNYTILNCRAEMQPNW